MDFVTSVKKGCSDEVVNKVEALIKAGGGLEADYEWGCRFEKPVEEARQVRCHGIHFDGALLNNKLVKIMEYGNWPFMSEVI